eukprot:TRINITY_DN1977_c0_g1_i3.p1 TRINITY_DN1977_c0_g1~~TRINITY_DN1977_c0_g1_i3.p1  ORF type:complete len:298 (-),score=42.71 TRINITY_DN1977_c0_g1_i3:157-1050(-)
MTGGGDLDDSFDDILKALSSSKAKLAQQRLQEVRTRGRASAERTRAADVKRKTVPGEPGHYRHPNGFRPGHATGGYFAPTPLAGALSFEGYLDGRDREAAVRPARCTERAPVAAFKPGSSVPQAFPETAKPLPACKREESFPGYAAAQHAAEAAAELGFAPPPATRDHSRPQSGAPSRAPSRQASCPAHRSSRPTSAHSARSAGTAAAAPVAGVPLAAALQSKTPARSRPSSARSHGTSCVPSAPRTPQRLRSRPASAVSCRAGGGKVAWTGGSAPPRACRSRPDLHGVVSVATSVR